MIHSKDGVFPQENGMWAAQVNHICKSKNERPYLSRLTHTHPDWGSTVEYATGYICVLCMLFVSRVGRDMHAWGWCGDFENV